MKINLNSIELDPRVMITLRCNFHCHFCSTPRPEKPIPEIPAEQWLKIISEIPFNQVRFSGGEPILHSGFKMIMRHIKKPYQIYTNMKLWTDEHLELANPAYVKMYISFHAEYGDVDDFIEKIKKIIKKGIRYDIHFVAVNGERRQKIIEFDQKMNAAGIKYSGAPDQRAIENKRKPGLCHINRSLYGPDGNRYPCMTYLREQKFAIPAKKHYTGILCDRRDCLPCDVDVLMNRR